MTRIGQLHLSELQRGILLTAYFGKQRGMDLVEFNPIRTAGAQEWREALTGLLSGDLITWVGAESFTLTEEGDLIASTLTTAVAA